MRTGIQNLTITISNGTLLQPLAAILAQHRAEEPYVSIELVETSTTQQRAGLKAGIYDVGLTLWHDGDSDLIAQPLWNDSLAIALPENSPLVRHDKIPLEEALRHRLVLWRSEVCKSMYERITQLVDTVESAPDMVVYVDRFDLMTTLVAAGYGIGFAPKSHILSVRHMGIVMRPIAETTPQLTTYLLSTDTQISGPAERFMMRALANY